MIGYAAGAWDLFHIGHLRLLKRVRKMHAGRLIVGVSTDELIEKMKGKKPTISFDQRWEIIEGLEIADDMIAQHSYDKVKMQNKLEFDVLYVGSDHKDDFKKYEDKMKVIFFPHTSGVSTSEIYERIKNTV